MKSIFDSTEMNHLKLNNRLIRSATWESLANDDGSLPEELIQIYEELAKGGVGAIITGLTDVSPYSRTLPGTMSLCRDELIPIYRHLTDRVKTYDCRILTEIAMGNYVKWDESKGELQTLDIDKLKERDIQDIVTLFGKAAVRAEKAGFDGVQIHAAHGFFLSRFISPAYNHRTDRYGGSPHNRARVLTDILKAIGESTSDIHVTIKINFHDYTDGGLTPPDALIACQMLAVCGIDSIEVSASHTSRLDIRPMENEAYFLDFALELKKLVDTPVVLVGGHRSIENMNRILNETPIEYLSLSRPLIREPHLPRRWQEGDQRPASCISCNGCYSTHGRRCVSAGIA